MTLTAHRYFLTMTAPGNFDVSSTKKLATGAVSGLFMQVYLVLLKIFLELFNILILKKSVQNFISTEVVTKQKPFNNL